jgi:hypothetical protein
VARRPKLPVLPGGGELREELFEDVEKQSTATRDISA